MSEKSLVQRNLGPKIVLLVQKIKVKKIKVQNILSQTNFGPIKSRAPKILGSNIKIGSVIAEIFLIWTNVARTNVA